MQFPVKRKFGRIFNFFTVNSEDNKSTLQLCFSDPVPPSIVGSLNQRLLNPRMGLLGTIKKIVP
jgi:hypothetical protein